MADLEDQRGQAQQLRQDESFVGNDGKKEAPPQLRVIQLFMSCRKLKNMDLGRDKSDTNCILKMKWHANQQDWTEVDQTEVIHDNLDPNYTHHFDVIYNFGQNLRMRFEVRDLDSDGKVTLIGAVEATLSELLTKQQDGFERPLTGPFTNAGHLKIVAKEKQSAKNKVTLDMQVRGLPQCISIWKFNFSTTYFMEVYKGPRGSNVKIYESHYWVDDLDEQFSNLQFDDGTLCNADPNCPIEFKFINRNQY